jgi:hypothetical protein
MIGWESGLPIKLGDPVFAIIVFRTIKKEGDSDIYDYPPGFEYTPIALPVFGEYNEYGSLKNIKTNYNTELLEKTLGNGKINIEEIFRELDDLACNRTDDVNIDTSKDFSFLLEHLSVYESLCEIDLESQWDIELSVKFCKDNWREINEISKFKFEDTDGGNKFHEYLDKIKEFRKKENLHLVSPEVSTSLLLKPLNINYFRRVPSDEYLYLYRNDVRLFNDLEQEYISFLKFLRSIEYFGIHFKPHHLGGQGDESEKIKKFIDYKTKIYNNIKYGD